MRAGALLAAVAVVRSCLALPQVNSDLSERASSDTVAVTGVNDGTTGMRREITELATDTDAFNLYLLALQRYLNSDTSDVLSYFQISGIHGLPCTPYSGVQGDSDAISQGGCGYCTHSSMLFPAWHRAYVALYEQGFYAQVQGVISDFASNPTQQAVFQKAASGLRIAYWDWAANGASSVPSILTEAQVTVPSPSGGSQTIANPFYQYKFQNMDSAVTGGSSPWSNWDDTLRCPSDSSSSATSQISQWTGNMKSAFSSIQALTYKMLLNCAQWAEMADDSAGTSSAGCASGLESIHDQVHVNIGGNGHMADLGHASFDPIFWLHHTNIDRLLSLWQVAQGKTWFASGSSGVATYTATANQEVDGDFPLTPFYKDAGSQTFWTPNELEDWTQFGYNYPETSGGLDSDKGSVVSAINNLYGTQTVSTASHTPTSTASRSSTWSSAIPTSSAPGKFSNSSATSTHAGTHPTSVGGGSGSGSDSGYGSYPSLSLPTSLVSLPTNLPSLLTPSGREYDWSANIVAQRMGLGGSFAVYIFFGDVPSDSSSWSTASNLVGTHGFFASSAMTATSGWLVSGSVDLTSALVAQIAGGNLLSLEALLVEPFLTAKLNWAVKKATGEVVANNAVPGLQVTVVSASVKSSSNSDTAPVWDTPTTHDNVTSSAAGGYSSNVYGSSSGYSSGSYVSSGSGSSSGSSGSSGSYGSSGSAGQCVPQVKYVYEYVYV